MLDAANEAPPMTKVFVLLSCVTLTACGTRTTPARSAERIVDLGHALAASDPSWDGSPAFARRVVAAIDKDGYTAGRVDVEEHFGTHLDAPAHFASRGWTVDAIPIDRFYRSA